MLRCIQSLTILLSLPAIVTAQSIVDGDSPLELISDEFELADGPAWNGWSLDFPDVKAGKLYRYNVRTKKTQVLSGNAGRISASYFSHGKLFLSNNGEGRITEFSAGKATPLTEPEGSGKDLARPNDLVVDVHGGIYWTLTRQSRVMYQGPDGYNDTLKYAVTDVPADDRAIGGPAGLARDWLGERDEQPWCCVVSYYEPNESLIVGRDAYEQYDVENLKLPETLRDDLSDRPNIYQRDQQIWQDVSDDEWRKILACYYGRITELDGQVKRVLDKLEETGALENTVVIFTADHGRYVGGHGLEAHNFGAFEEIYAIPLVIAGPGVVEGVSTDALVGFHDIGPTILDLAGAEQLDVSDSASFAELLSDPSGGRDRSGYAEYFGSRFRLTQRIYWEDEWKFVFNGFDFDELYNLVEDPLETRNLASIPEHADRVKHMMTGIWRRMHETGDTTLLNSHYHSMRFAAVGPNTGNE